MGSTDLFVYTYKGCTKVHPCVIFKCPETNTKILNIHKTKELTQVIKKGNRSVV